MTCKIGYNVFFRSAYFYFQELFLLSTIDCKNPMASYFRYFLIVVIVHVIYRLNVLILSFRDKLSILIAELTNERPEACII